MVIVGQTEINNICGGKFLHHMQPFVSFFIVVLGNACVLSNNYELRSYFIDIFLWGFGEKFLFFDY